MTEDNISFPPNPGSNPTSKLMSSPSPGPSDGPRIISRANFSPTSPPYMLPSTPETSNDHTQSMSFGDYIEWHNGSGPGGQRSAGLSAEEIEARMMVSFHSESVPRSSSETGGSESTILDEDNDFVDEPVPTSPPVLPESSSASQLEAPAPAPHYHNPSLETRSMIRGLRIHAGWSYTLLKNTFQVPLGTLHRIIHSSNTPERHLYLRRGRPITLSPEVQHQLIDTATANAHNRRLPLTQIADLAGVSIGARALKRVFAGHGYHRRVARVKPFLSPAAKSKRQSWAETYEDWEVDDWQDVIWSDECAFSVGNMPGTVWVTRKPGEEYLEDCLVPKFPRLTTVMVWAAIYRDLKGPLVIWDAANWGRINGSTYIDKIIRPHLHPWYISLQQAGSSNSGYIYFQHDGAAAHHSKHAVQALQELGIGPYTFPWPPSSPDMSPIENIWQLLKRRIQNRHPRPTTVSALHTAIYEEWDRITPNEILNFTSTLPERVEELLLHHGGHTSW